MNLKQFGGFCLFTLLATACHALEDFDVFNEFPIGVFNTTGFGNYTFFNATNLDNSTPFEGEFKFRVKTMGEVMVTFTRTDNPLDIEYLIGTGNNSEVIILINRTEVERLQAPNILSNDDYNNFTIKWQANGEFYFEQQYKDDNGTVLKKRHLMLIKKYDALPVDLIGIGSSGDDASWIVHEEKPPIVFKSVMRTFNTTQIRVGDSLTCQVVEINNHNSSDFVYVHTLDTSIVQRKYTYVPVNNTDCYNIKIRAKHDAHIALTPTYDFTEIVEYHFGYMGSNNFTMQHNFVTKDDVFIPNLIDDTEYHGFWLQIDKSTNNLKFGKNETVLLSSVIEPMFPVNFIGVMTSDGSEGDWIIQSDGKCPMKDDHYEFIFQNEMRTVCTRDTNRK